MKGQFIPSRDTCTPEDMEAYKAAALKLLEVLKTGARVSRLNCHALGVAPKNSSIHTMVSTIEGRFGIPVMRSVLPNQGNVKEYFLSDKTLEAINDPDLSSLDRITSDHRRLKADRGLLKLTESLSRDVQQLANQQDVVNIPQLVLDQIPDLIAVLQKVLMLKQTSESQG